MHPAYDSLIAPLMPLEGRLLTPDGSQDVAQRVDISFLHRSFCLAGLPLRKPKDPDSMFSRNDDRFALTINPARFMLPGGKVCDVGVPWGAKSRLLIVWAATEVKDPCRRSGDRWLEIGRIKEWLTSIGIKVYGDSLAATKDQLVRLAFSQFTMILKGQNADTLFKRDNLIEAGAFPEDDLALYADNRLDKVRWPRGIELSLKAYERFSNHAIPVPTARLAEIANSAMAIDIFVFLCYRLPLITPQEEELVTWRELIAQFGSNEAPSKFRDTFTVSIKNALQAYPEANVALTDEGLRLRYADPAALRRAFIAVPRRTEVPEIRRRRLTRRSERSGEERPAMAV